MRGRRAGSLCALGLLILFAGLATWAAVVLPPTTDEVLYMGASEGLLEEGAWDSPYTRFQGPVGLYFNRIFASPYRVEGERDRQAFVTSGRLGMVIAAVLLGVGIFLFSRTLFGIRGGLFSLALYCLNPMMIGYGAIIPVDLVHAGTTLLALFGVWWYARSPSLVRALVFGMTAGLVFATKYLAVFLIPPLLLIAFLYGFLRPGNPRKEAMLKSLGELLAAALAVYATMHVAYLFHGGFAPTSLEAYDSPPLRRIAQIPGANLLLFALPEPYAIGLDERLGANQVQGTFAMGAYGDNPAYFLWALLLKTPDAILFLVLLWLPLVVLRYRKGQATNAGERTAALIFCATVVPGMLVLSFFVKYKIGVRYALQYVPPLFVLMGFLPSLLRSWRPSWSPVAVRSLVAGVLLLQGLETLAAGPNFIGYFNRVSGGKAKAFRYFTDSNTDWAQYYEEGERLLREREAVQPEFLRGLAGPRFGRVALYVKDSIERDPFDEDRPWHWLRPFQPVAHFEAAWYVFEITEEEYAEKARTEGPRVRADLALAYLGAGRVEEARIHVQACEGGWRDLLGSVLRLLDQAQPEVRDVLSLIQRINLARSPDLVLALLDSERIAPLRHYDLTRYRAQALARLRRSEEAIETIRADTALMERPAGILLLAGIYVAEFQAQAAIELLEANPWLKEKSPDAWERMMRRAKYRSPFATRGTRTYSSSPR